MSYDPLDSQCLGERMLHRHEKRCSTCREVKPHQEFSPDRRQSDGLQVQCKLCRRKYKRNSYATGGAAYQATLRWSARQTIKSFGLELEDYPKFKLLDNQKGD